MVRLEALRIGLEALRIGAAGVVVVAYIIGIVYLLSA